MTQKKLNNIITASRQSTSACVELRAARPYRGFSIVELVVIMVIIGLIAAVSIPRFFDQSGFQEKGFYDETVAAVRYAHKRAYATGCTIRVVTSAASGTYSIFRAGGVLSACNTGPYSTPITHPTGTGNFTGTAPSGITLSNSDFTFNPDGSAALAGAGSVTITVGGRSFRVIEATGYVD